MAFTFNLGLLSVFLAVIVFSVRKYFKRKFSYWNRKGVPSIPASIPFGNMTQNMIQRKSHAETIADQYHYFERQGHRFGGFYSMTRPILIPIDPELIKTFLIKEFVNFHNRPFAPNDEDSFTNELMFSVKGTKWRFLRTKLTPTFTSGKMKIMFGTMLACAQGLETVIEESLEKDEPIDIKDVLARYTTDVIGSCGFGIECNSLNDPENEFRQFSKKLFRVSKLFNFQRFLFSIIPFMNRLVKFRLIEKSASDFFLSAIQQTVEYRERNHIERNDFMNLLIKLKNNESVNDDDDGGKDSEQGLSFNQLVAQCFTFFFGGFETSSSTMTYCLYELSKNEGIQEKLRQEIIETLKKYKGQLTYEGVMEMSYMDKVVKETLRKYPIISVVQRQCVNDFKMPEANDLILEKGTTVFISVLGLHRNPKYYPDPLKFDPERFSDEQKFKRHQCVYLPFGEGPRNCIGMRFGLMQTKVGLAILLRRYKFTLNEKTVDPLIFDPKSFILSVENGVWLNAKKLN